MSDGLQGRLCVPLDSSERATIVSLAAAVGPSAALLKVGLTALHALGPSIVEEVARVGPVFVDAKLHDIPVQVAGAAEAISELGAWCLTVHAAGGRDMIAAAAEAAGESKVIAVTVLTSLDAGDLAAAGVSGTVEDLVARLATLAVEAGAAGIVCSPREVALLRSLLGGDAFLVVPGIRPRGYPSDDQRRTATPAEAVAAGADVVVVGRPITAAPDPAAAAARIAAEVNA